MFYKPDKCLNRNGYASSNKTSLTSASLNKKHNDSNLISSKCPLKATYKVRTKNKS